MRCVTNASVSSRCCTKDGSRPPEVGLQEQASNHLVLLRSKGVVVNNGGKDLRSGSQVSVEEMSESKPSDDASLRVKKLPKGVAGTVCEFFTLSGSGGEDAGATH